MGRPSDSPDQRLAKALRAFRVEKGVTQEDLAHEAGVTVATVRRIEAGTSNPTWTTVRRLATALGVSVATLGDRVED